MSKYRCNQIPECATFEDECEEDCEPLYNGCNKYKSEAKYVPSIEKGMKPVTVSLRMCESKE